MTKRIVRWGYAPLMLIGVNGVAIAWLSRDAAPGWLVPLLGLAIAASFAAERVAPWSPAWNRPLGDRPRDAAHAIVNETASLASLASLPLLVAALGTAGAWPSELPFALQVVGGILVLDVGIALAHFASHRVAWLWRFHAVHHSVRRMYGLNGLMKHPVHQAIETLAGTTPLIVVGLPTDVAVALVFATAIQLILQHSNVDYRVGPLRRWLAVAEVHRFHHRKEPELGDVNFGLFTTLVDHALGTYHWEPEAPRTSDALGIEAERDYPDAYLEQLVRPFRKAGA